MLINISNHPSNDWENSQAQSAIKIFGEVIELPFPNIDPMWSSVEVKGLAKKYFEKIMRIFDQYNNQLNVNAVHIQGEFTFVYQLVSMLKSSNISCVASTSTRNVVEMENGEKVVKFSFVQFREY